jgi:hypothetical protein
VPRLFPKGGAANPGDILVSNFNNSSNLQGTGTTIIDVPAQVGAPSPTLFFQSATPAGLTTALDILRAGYVLVGNFPSPDGSCGSATAGSIIVINKSGQQVGNITGPSINGPWDSAIFDEGNKAKYFVANALTGTVVRLKRQRDRWRDGSAFDANCFRLHASMRPGNLRGCAHRIGLRSDKECVVCRFV